MNHDTHPSTSLWWGHRAPLNPAMAAITSFWSLGLSPATFGREHTFLSSTGPKLLLRLPQALPRQVHTAGFCTNKTDQFTPTPSCGHAGHKSWPAPCTHLSFQPPGLWFFLPRGLGCAHSICTALGADGTGGKVVWII